MKLPSANAVWLRPECRDDGVELVTGAEGGKRLGFGESVVSTWLARDPQRCPAPCAVEAGTRWFVWEELRRYAERRPQFKIDALEAELVEAEEALVAATEVRDRRRADAASAQGAYDRSRRRVAYLQRRLGQVGQADS